MQEVELAGREHDRIPVLRDRPRRRVETEGSDLERVPLFPRAAPAHDGPDPSRELPRREGFDDVVVGAQLEPEDAIDLLPPRGEHHDRDIRSLTDLACEITSVSVRQHHLGPGESVGSDGLPRGRLRALAPLRLRTRLARGSPPVVPRWSVRPRPGGSASSWLDGTSHVWAERGPVKPLTHRKDLDLSFLTAETQTPKDGSEAEGGRIGCHDCRRRRRGSPWPARPEPLRLRVLEVSVFLVVLAGLLWRVAANWTEFVSTASQLLPWLVIVVIADLLPVPIWGFVELMMSFPFLLFGPRLPSVHRWQYQLRGNAGLREFRGEISPLRDLYNRSNVTASVLVHPGHFTSSESARWLGLRYWPSRLWRCCRYGRQPQPRRSWLTSSHWTVRSAPVQKHLWWYIQKSSSADMHASGCFLVDGNDRFFGGWECRPGGEGNPRSCWLVRMFIHWKRLGNADGTRRCPEKEHGPVPRGESNHGYEGPTTH